MFRLIRKWLQKLFKKETKCKYCKFKMDAGSTWYCRRIVKGRYNYKSICGKPRVQTAPKWCPLRRKYGFNNR